jgi:hypothetical protein
MSLRIACLVLVIHEGRSVPYSLDVVVVVALAQLFKVETEGTKKYSPPLEVTKKGFGSPGGGAAPLGVTLANPDTSNVVPSLPVSWRSTLSPDFIEGDVPWI